MANLKGWSYLTLFVCYLSGLLNASPVQRRDGGPVAPLYNGPSSVSVSPVANAAVDLDVAGALQLVNRDVDAHSYAMNCINDREHTDYCNRQGFVCTSKGKLARVLLLKDYFCEDFCWCQDLSPPTKPLACIIKNMQKCKGIHGVNTDCTSVSQLAYRDADTNNYALDCENDRLRTNDCTLKGFFCTQDGVLAISRPVKDEYCENSCWCQSLSLVFQPVPCYLRNTRQCLVVDGIASDAETGETIGDVSLAKVLADGALDFNPALGNRDTDLADGTLDLDKRDTNIAHDYALVCRNRIFTSMCQDPEHHGYYCDSGGKIKRKKSVDKLCEATCQCINVRSGSTKPIPCWASGLDFIQLNCFIKGATIYDVNDAIIGSMKDATMHPNGSLEYTPAATEKRDTKPTTRHDFALNCWTRAGTELCQKKPFDYYCAASGKVLHRGQEVKFCKENCKCTNLRPPPAGDVLGDNDGTALGNLTDAHHDGTVNAPAVIEKRNLDLAKRHDWALVCIDRAGTNACQKYHGYFCNSKGRVFHRGPAHPFCALQCVCVNLKPKPKPKPKPSYCIASSPYIIVGCSVKDAILDNENNGTALGNLTDAHSHLNGTYELTSTTIEQSTLAKRHNYALVCEDRDGTSLCGGAPFYYTCNANGKLQYRGVSSYCQKECRCQNLQPVLQNCLVLPYLVVGCNIKDNVLYDIDNGVALGDVKDAGIHLNGTYDLTKVVARDVMKAKTTPILTATYMTLLPPTATVFPPTIQDIIFGCASNNGVQKGTWSFDLTLTNYCKTNGYSCAMVEGPLPSPVYQLNTPLWPVVDCDAGCLCAGKKNLRMMAAREAMQTTTASIPVVTKVSVTPPVTTPPNTLDFSTSTGVVELVAPGDNVRRSEIVNGASHDTDPLGPVILECFSHFDKYNSTLTDYCWDNDYGCQQLIPGTWEYTTNHWGDEIPECTHSCRCPNMHRRRDAETVDGPPVSS